MTEYDNGFLQKLRKLCLEFDVKCDNWPEHELEGFALFEYARNPVSNPAEKWHDSEDEEDETGYVDEWMEMTGRDEGA